MPIGCVPAKVMRGGHRDALVRISDRPGIGCGRWSAACLHGRCAARPTRNAPIVSLCDAFGSDDQFLAFGAQAIEDRQQFGSPLGGGSDRKWMWDGDSRKIVWHAPDPSSLRLKLPYQGLHFHHRLHNDAVT